MSDKKLFPGVTPEEVLQKERDEEQQKIEMADKEKRALAEQERQNKRSKYVLPETDLKSTKEIRKDFIKNFLSVNVVAFLSGSFFWILWGWSFCRGNNGVNKISDCRTINYTPYAQALYDAYIPISNGKTKKFKQTTCIERGKFAPTVGWVANMVVMFIGLVGAAVTARRQKRATDNIKLHNSTVDMMLDLEEFGDKYNLNTPQVAHMINNVSSIIREMSADKRVYFDMILDGRINIRENEIFLKMATHIMYGHLTNHPEDINRILSVYNWRSVPLDLLAEYDKYITDRYYRTR